MEIPADAPLGGKAWHRGHATRIDALFALVRLGAGAVLLVSDFFQPNDVRAVECLLHCNVDHCSRWPRAVPVLLSRWDPHGVAWRDFADRTAPGLNTSCSREHVQGLPQLVGVPGGPCAGVRRSPAKL